MADMVSKGRQVQKLKPAEVAKILVSPLSAKEVAATFNVTAVTIRRLWAGRLRPSLVAGLPKVDRQGVRCGRLTECAVKEILASPEPSRVLGEKFGVNPSLVRAIRRGEVWRHVAAGGGAANVRRRLTAVEVKEIRASKERVCVVAKRYGLVPSHVRSIRANEIWREVPVPKEFKL